MAWGNFGVYCSKKAQCVFALLVLLGTVSSAHIAPHAGPQPIKAARPSTPSAYIDGHSHDRERYPQYDHVVEKPLTNIASDFHTAALTSSLTPSAQVSSSRQDCHVHGGVEHCVERGNKGNKMHHCVRHDQEHNVNLRIGLVFVVLLTSFMGVAGPIFLASLLPARLKVVFVVLKQFGTGVIVSTAFIHLYTHASLMFNSECLEDLGYEATTSAILMAGLFVSFVVDCSCHKVGRWLGQSDKAYNMDLMRVLVLEAGIVFHSSLIGLTLVVAGDKFFLRLFFVIVVHQVFEGIALGTVIASIGQSSSSETAAPAMVDGPPLLVDADPVKSNASSATGLSPAPASDFSERSEGPKLPSMRQKLVMAVTFALTTPLGMVIGIAVLDRFNGNDATTLIALGTLDAFSAGILAWVGLVEMWAKDWLFGGELVDAGATVTLCAGLGLMAGMGMMSLLGKWA